ncbi:hypothetical protein M422DRAFT_23954 [Sphaerobolus stellatus SS14]|nr:hypothetical protein M422DRAFT_23954 [Sphaerobolus stellatus SS14]
MCGGGRQTGWEVPAELRTATAYWYCGDPLTPAPCFHSFSHPLRKTHRLQVLSSGPIVHWASALRRMVDVVNPLRQYSLNRMPVINLSASSSKSSLLSEQEDENDTITAKRIITRGREHSHEDLHILAVSAQITEISFSISDIQTRIFEIQELRHKSTVEKPSTSDLSQSTSSESSSSSIIDQALINLDERLEAVSRSVEAVEESLGPLLRSVKTPTQNRSDDVSDGDKILLRKHADLLGDWDAVQTEAEVLREELKEDKWLTVFRSVSEQADGMMKSLEKAVTQCQDFIFQVNKWRTEATQTLSSPESNPINLDIFMNIHNAFESKKKYYMPSVTKILSVVDKGMRDRQTKNGECLRMNAEMRQRWRNLRERIGRIDSEMENVRRMLSDRLETDSSTSHPSTSKSGNGFLNTPSPPRSRAPSTTSTLSRSISPFRRFAARLAAPGRSTPSTKGGTLRLPSSEPVPNLRERASRFFRSGHKATSSMSEVSPLQHRQPETKKRWNSSTKVENEPDSTIKPVTPRRPSAAQAFSGSPSMSGRMTPSSQASSRPWSPSNSTMSTPSTHFSPTPSVGRPSSRATSSFGIHGTVNPRPRPQTPSQIPMPSPGLHTRSASRMSDWSDAEMMPSTIMQRALSPDSSPLRSPKTPSSPNRSTTPRASLIPTPRSVNVSQIPVPRVSISRPGSAMSNRSGITSNLPRAQTPESSIRARAQQIPFYQSSSATRSRPLLASKGPPSSFRDTSGTATPTSSTMRSRPSSRGGVFTPNLEQSSLPVYIPGNMKDPLDVEVAKVVNSITHGMLVERVDPPLRGAPRAGEELKAQYAFANALARKVLNCRLVVIGRAGAKGGETRKVMCRVGGGWQDLSMYLLSRAAGNTPA